jgi:hypothetical protein
MMMMMTILTWMVTKSNNTVSHTIAVSLNYSKKPEGKKTWKSSMVCLTTEMIWKRTMTWKMKVQIETLV